MMDRHFGRPCLSGRTSRLTATCGTINQSVNQCGRNPELILHKVRLSAKVLSGSKDLHLKPMIEPFLISTLKVIPDKKRRL
jgi:hypothetical protein